MLPVLTWQCGLKHTGVELELLTDYEMLLMLEDGILGGYSGVLGVCGFTSTLPIFTGLGWYPIVIMTLLEQ